MVLNDVCKNVVGFVGKVGVTMISMWVASGEIAVALVVAKGPQRYGHDGGGGSCGGGGGGKGRRYWRCGGGGKESVNTSGFRQIGQLGNLGVINLINN